MAFPSVMSPVCALREEYPDAQTIQAFANLAVNNVLAPVSDISGLAQTLLLGASSNVIIESASDAKMFLKDNSAFTVWNSSFTSSGARTDTTLLDLRSNANPEGGVGATVISTGSNGNVLMVHGSDAFQTTWISSAIVKNYGQQTQFSTSQSDGFLFHNPTEFFSNVTMDKDCYMKSTLEVDDNVTFYKNFFTPNVNIWHDDIVHNNRVGFAFTINEKNQLQLIKYINGATTGTNVTKTIAVFGNSPMNGAEQSDGTSYLVFDELSGVGVHQTAGSQTSAGGVITNDVNYAAWTFTQLGSIFTNASAVGIGNDSPQAMLDVGGSINALSVSAGSVTTTSDERLKDIRGTLDGSACLDKIASLDVIDFAYTSSPHDFKAGLRAQQVETVMADAVITKKFAGLDDCMLIDSSVMLAYLVGAVKELAAKIA